MPRARQKGRPVSENSLANLQATQFTPGSSPPRCTVCGGGFRARGSLFCWAHQPGRVPGAAFRHRKPKGKPAGPAGPVVPDIVLAVPDAGTGDRETTPGYDGVARKVLLQVARDPKASATARTHAARTLAELDGWLGKHQQAPDRTADMILSSLSRADLVRELARLRARTAADAARDSS
jgi:hypothetical protein